MTTREPSPTLGRSAAVDSPDGSPDCGVPLHFGDPLGEQRATISGYAIIDRSHRDVLQVSGSERLSWLEGFLSQHVAELADGQAGETLILDANGRVEHHLQLADCGGIVTLDTEGGAGEPVLDFLRKMVFWAQVDPAPSELAVLSLVGEELPDTLTSPHGERCELPDTPYQCAPLPGGGFVRTLPWPGQRSIDLVVPRTSLSDWFDAAVAEGAQPAGMWTYEALRVACSHGQRARVGIDTDAKTIPHEVPAWIGSIAEHGAVHLDKGCYRGQETVARVHNLGRSPRVLLRLQLDGSSNDLPATGDPVTADGRPVGRVGTVVHHCEQGPIALALIKRSIPVDTELMAGEVCAAIDPDSLPVESGPQAGREAVKRLRGQ